jgi:hypothetical protein
MDKQAFEVIQPHTHLLRLALAVEESRAYWQHSRPNIPESALATFAFEERWFGHRSMERVRLLLNNLALRFDAYPAALDVLRFWQPSDPTTRANLCHWHTQLSDPLYRSFTSQLIPQRYLLPTPSIDRDVVARWLVGQIGTSWAPATTMRMATSLLTSAAAAGLCSQGVGVRQLKTPKVTDEALVYLLYLLRDVVFEGSLLANPYLASVGLNARFLEQRLSRLSGLTFQRMGDLYEFTWHYLNLKAWAEGTLKAKSGIGA